MDRTIAGLAWNICLYYLDDIIVFSATWAEHLERLRAVFERLRRANLKLGAHKCQLAAQEVSFLGYKVTPEGLEPEPRLMEAISKLPPPINVSEVRSFLGLVGYYRRFVKRFSDKAAPLNSLVRKDQAWNWTQECQHAFETLKGEIASRPVSAYPDFSKPFWLYTDASNIGLGAILTQKQEGKEKNNLLCLTDTEQRRNQLQYHQEGASGHSMGCSGIPTLSGSYSLRDLDRSLRSAVVKVYEEHLSDPPSLGSFP